MEKVYLLKENEAREIGIFLRLLLIKSKDDKINHKLLKKYEKMLWN